jgi:AAA15 family ATPase/GTPase
MFFNHIDIHNFRGIESLTIKNIKQVNLITGRNNCGKTSVLEAIFLLTGMSNPQLILSIHSFRNISLTDNDDFSYIFNNFDLSQYPSITGQLDSHKRNLKIKAVDSITLKPLNHNSEQLQLPKEKFISNLSTDKQDTVEGLTFYFNIDGKDFQSGVKLNLGQSNLGQLNLGQLNLGQLNSVEIKLAQNYKENLIGNFINPQTIMNNLDRRLDAMLVRKDLGTIVNAIKKIEPNLIDIRMGARGMIYADIGIDKLVPINILGDGIRRILAILAAISERKNSILLIDEIENGLHFRTLSILWKAVLKAALDNNVQLFITTHSYECIEALTEIYEENTLNLEEDFITLFRIDKDDKGQHLAFQYETDVLLAGIEKNFEVR